MGPHDRKLLDMMWASFSFGQGLQIKDEIQKAGSQKD